MLHKVETAAFFFFKGSKGQVVLFCATWELSYLLETGQVSTYSKYDFWFQMKVR